MVSISLSILTICKYLYSWQACMVFSILFCQLPVSAFSYNIFTLLLTYLLASICYI